MINFRPITLADKATIESYTLRSSIRNCDLSFANFYAWQPTYRSAWAEVNGFLVIRFFIEGGEKIGYMQPIGTDGGLEFSSIIPLLAQDAHLHGDRLRIIGVTEEGRASLTQIYEGRFAFYSNRDEEDYIYRRESLASLSGKRLQPKRNHVNQFAKRYSDIGYHYRELTAADFEACLELDCKWRASRGDCGFGGSDPERSAMERSFAHFEELELRGGALFVGEEMVAFTYGSAINGDTFCVHIEKGLTDAVGCYTVVNKLFAESLPEQYIYVNREEDMGIEGLRRAKLSYYPDHLQVKYNAIYLHHDESECRRLWIDVFADEELFVDEFLTNHYRSSRMLRVATEGDNRYVSMLHIIEFESEIGRIAYIYGVATDRDYRGLGYARLLLQEALHIIEEEGFAAAMLIPGEEWLQGYYAKFGFANSSKVLFNSNFDFGSGDPNADISMALWFNNANSITTEPLILTLV
ncbi:MAG: GNAT family N-acetyltransferase [Rikenellaceae bacterium]